MSNLCYNSTPAERARGCVFAERFESPTHVARNRGTVTGTVPIDFGATYPGVAGNYVSYVVGGLLNRAAISIVFEFWPWFAADDAVQRILLSTTGGTGFYIFKNNTNALEFYYNGGSLRTIALGTYQSYWYTNNRNVLVVSAISGTNNFYLNGMDLTGTAIAWVPTDPGVMYIGSSWIATLPFIGKIGQTKIFTGDTAASCLTQREAYDYYHQRTY